jgi:hypothetical protein
MRQPRLPKLFCFVLFFCVLTQTSAVLADNSSVWQRPNWDRELALLTASLSDTASEADRLTALLQNASTDASMQALVQLLTRTDWSLPAREASLFQFTNQLRQLPPFSVDASVMGFLAGYSSQTLVPHEESWGYGVPLYPISAAAQGVINQWTRQQAGVDAADLLTRQAKQVVDLYIETGEYNLRAGIEDALANAQPAVLRMVLDYALPQLAANPDLTGLTGKAALHLADTRALSQVMTEGRGHMLVEITRQAGKTLPSAGLGSLLLSSIESAPASTSAMMIAEWAPQTVRQQKVGKVLMQKLEHPELGSTVALALVQWGSEQQLEALLSRAMADDTTVAAKRVQSALSISQSNRAEGGRR